MPDGRPGPQRLQGPDLADPPGHGRLFYLRGALFKATLAIHNVNEVGYRTVADASGAALDTQVLNVNFGTDFAVRAYADISPDPATRYIGDVLLEHVPAGPHLLLPGPEQAHRRRPRPRTRDLL